MRSMIDRVGPHAGLRTGRGWRRPCSALWRLCSRSAEISGDKKLGCRGGNCRWLRGHAATETDIR